MQIVQFMSFKISLDKTVFHTSVKIVYPDSLKNRDKFLAFSDRADSVARMIQSGFLNEKDRKALTALARDGSSPVSYTHLRAHETVLDLVCRLLLEKKKKKK